MKLISVTFTDEDFEALQKHADERRMSVQEYIRFTVLKKEPTMFTVEEADRRAHEKYKCGDTFALPDLYSDEEWSKLPKSMTGGFGRKWFNFVNDKSADIEFMGVVRRLAKYRLVSGKDDDKED